MLGILFYLPLVRFTDGLSCTEYKSSVGHKYYPVRHCQRSNQTIVGLSNVNSVDKCADFALKRRAMAFNFAPLDRKDKNLFDQLKGEKIIPQFLESLNGNFFIC